MMNWRAIPPPELCFPEADSFGAIWFGVFSLLNKSDPRNHTKFLGSTAGSLPARTRKLRVRTFLAKLLPFVFLGDRFTCTAGCLPARTRKLRVRTFLQKDTTGLIQSIMRIGLHSPRSSGDKPIG
ncbi:MAG: hypothetical protein QOH42_2067 [Blastocatellia bacterium]|nr:hypothetical protein [Blastocatellia bacterium]